MKRKRKGPTFIQIYNEHDPQLFSFTKLVLGMGVMLLLLLCCRLINLLI